MSEAVASNLIPEWDDDNPLKIILIAGIFVLSVITLTAIAVGISALHSTDHTVAESAYSYRFQPNASITIPYSTYWKATPTESGPYWLYKEQPTVNTTCLNRRLPDKFAIDRHQKNGELQRIEIVNEYDVPVALDKYRVRDCLSKHGTVRVEGDMQ